MTKDKKENTFSTYSDKKDRKFKSGIDKKLNIKQVKLTEKQTELDIVQFKFNDQIQNSMLKELEIMLRERGRKGIHLIDKEELHEFLDGLMKRHFTDDERRTKAVEAFIDKATNKWKVLHVLERKFFNEQICINQYSLHMETFSLEALAWILRSLLLDKVTPYEKTIKNRIKEFHGIKIDMTELRK